MAGRMGGVQHTVQNLKVLMTDNEKGILVVKGLVSGPKNTYVRVYDSKKMPWQAKDLGLKMGEEVEVLESKPWKSSMAPIAEVSEEVKAEVEELVAAAELNIGAAAELRR